MALHHKEDDQSSLDPMELRKTETTNRVWIQWHWMVKEITSPVWIQSHLAILNIRQSTNPVWIQWHCTIKEMTNPVWINLIWLYSWWIPPLWGQAPGVDTAALGACPRCGYRRFGGKPPVWILPLWGQALGVDTAALGGSLSGRRLFLAVRKTMWLAPPLWA